MKNRVKEVRNNLELTLMEVEEKSTVPVSTISDMEHGRTPMLDSAMRVAEALETSVYDLWSLE